MGTGMMTTVGVAAGMGTATTDMMTETVVAMGTDMMTVAMIAMMTTGTKLSAQTPHLSFFCVSDV